MALIGGINVPRAPKVGAGSSVGPLGIRAARPKKVTNPFAPAPVKAAPQTSPYDQFQLPLPYQASQIPQQANTDYASDVANATKLASMGYLTPDQENARAASQASNVQGIAQSLRDQLAGIQTATVQQGNAGGAVLGGQNAATAASGNPVAGALGVPNTGVQGASGAQAVLGSQTAAGGNYLGGLEAAALSSGATNAAKATAAGASNIATDQSNIQKTLASLLAGTPTPAAREATMTQANTSAQSANLQTKLSVYQSLVNQASQEAALGEKAQATSDTLAANKYLRTIDDQTKVTTTNANNATKLATTSSNNRTKSQIAADNAAASGKRTAAQIAAANKRAADANKTKLSTAQIAANKKTSGKGYQVSYVLPATNVVDPNTGKLTLKPPAIKTKPVNAAVWQRYLNSGPEGRRKLSILGLPDKTKIKSSVARS